MTSADTPSATRALGRRSSGSVRVIPLGLLIPTQSWLSRNDRRGAKDRSTRTVTSGFQVGWVTAFHPQFAGVRHDIHALYVYPHWSAAGIHSATLRVYNMCVFQPIAATARDRRSQAVGAGCPLYINTYDLRGVLKGAAPATPPSLSPPRTGRSRGRWHNEG